MNGGDMEVKLSRMAAISVALTVVALAATTMGALGAHFALLPVFPGFMIFGFGLLAGVVSFFLGGIGILRTRPGSGRVGRSLAAFAFVVGGGLTMLAVALAVPGNQTPVINDITTDRNDPPVFVTAGNAPENRGQDLTYPTSFSQLQHVAYPDVAPVELELSPDAAFARAQDIAVQLGWKIQATDSALRTFEATDQTAFFHFVDDIAVRVRPTRTGALVDIRSRSRMGKGDLGTNARRIRTFLKSLDQDENANSAGGNSQTD